MQTSRRTTLVATVLGVIGVVAVAVPLRAQSTIIEMEPGTVGHFTFVCADASGRTLPNCCSVFANGNYLNSGGHLHNQGRPWSTLVFNSSCYVAGRGIALDIDARHGVGQMEYIHICSQGCPTCPVYCDFTDVKIRYWPFYDLYGYAVPPYNWPVGAVSGYHVNNHFGTSTLTYAVDQITLQYYGEFYCVPDAQGIKGYRRVGVNDMGLEGGGVFDIDAPRGASFAWKPPHKWHSSGNSVDFRCKPNQEYSIIYVDQVIGRFLEICDEKGLHYRIRESQGLSKEHVHCGVRAGN